MNLVRLKENQKLIDNLRNDIQTNLSFALFPVYRVGNEIRSKVHGDGVALYSEAHKKPSILSKWFWKGLYMSIFGFKFSENAVEMVDSTSFGSKIKNA